MTATRVIAAIARIILVAALILLVAWHHTWRNEVRMMFGILFLAVCLVGADLDRLSTRIDRGVDIHVKVDE